MFDLSMMNAQSDGIKFIQRVLGYFNFNFKQASKSHINRDKIDKMIAVVPPTK